MKPHGGRYESRAATPRASARAISPMLWLSRAAMASMLLFFVASAQGFAFTAPRPAFKHVATPIASPRNVNVHTLRGGMVEASVLTSAFSGAMAIPTAAGISAIAGSLAYIRQAYIFSLSYGLSMLGIGGALLPWHELDLKLPNI